MTEVKQQIPRAAQRYMERIQQEAKETAQKLCEKFLTYFMSLDNPEGPEVAEQVKTVHAKWLVYCNNKKLHQDARNVVKLYMQSVIDDFKKQKNDNL